MKPMAMVIVAMAAGLLGGCATAGTKEIRDPEIVKQIVPGKTTKAEVQTLLGKPAGVDFTDAGLEKWAYMYTQATTRGTSFVPIVGLFAGGMDTETDSLTILFDEKGIVKKIGGGAVDGGGGGLQDKPAAPRSTPTGPAKRAADDDAPADMSP